MSSEQVRNIVNRSKWTYNKRFRNGGKTVIEGTNEYHVTLPYAAIISSLILLFIFTLSFCIPFADSRSQ